MKQSNQSAKEFELNLRQVYNRLPVKTFSSGRLQEFTNQVTRAIEEIQEQAGRSDVVGVLNKVPMLEEFRGKLASFEKEVISDLKDCVGLEKLAIENLKNE